MKKTILGGNNVSQRLLTSVGFESPTIKFNKTKKLRTFSKLVASSNKFKNDHLHQSYLNII